MSINKLFFQGTLGQDAEVKEMSTGSKAIIFSVAVTRDYKDKADGTWKKETSWIKATRWVAKDGSTKIAELLKKGTKVTIMGRPHVSAWINKNGDAQGSLECNIEEIDISTFAPKDEDNHSSPAQNTYQSNDTNTDDLPF